jgi:hypothetical protein
MDFRLNQNQSGNRLNQNQSDKNVEMMNKTRIMDSQEKGLYLQKYKFIILIFFCQIHSSHI